MGLERNTDDTEGSLPRLLLSLNVVRRRTIRQAAIADKIPDGAPAMTLITEFKPITANIFGKIEWDVRVKSEVTHRRHQVHRERNEEVDETVYENQLN